eukprot:TRINITY_DN4770_c0_g1_i3.p1 TRINITY_DN4770_c0_g1~~TRINITY_DN4770_c0_g1_i3.p1  ORF type:complete len:528 (-),score=127.29 TRINITY_DN4770_c0_g1_i3:21-1604(-)
MSNLSRRKWLSIPTVSIPAAGPYSDPSSSQYIAYKIVVKDGTSSWTLMKRYSKLHELASQIQDRYPEVKLPPFPPKTAFWEDEKNPQFVEKRRAMLEMWLQKVLSEARLLQSAEVRTFLDPEYATDRTSLLNSADSLQSSSSSLSSSGNHNLNGSSSNNGGIVSHYRAPGRSNDPTKFLIPPPSSSVSVPEMIEFRGECYFATALIASVRDNVEFLAVLKSDLESAKTPIERLNFFETMKERATTTTTQLKDEQNTMSILLQSPAVVSTVPLYEYLDVCVQQIGKAIAWFSEAEVNITERIQSEGEVGEKGKLEERIKVYEELIEKLLLDAFACTTPQQVAGVESSLSGVIEKIVQDIGLTKSVVELESYGEKLKYLRDYANNNLDVLRQFREMSPEDHVASLESRMFSILDALSTFDLPANADTTTPIVPQSVIARNTELHNKITKLMKDMSMCRNLLKTKYSDKTHLLNRIEDLQENLVDLEHDFVSKHKIERGFESMALDLLKNRLLNQARTEHEQRECDLFEL